ncbi:MAG: hypothetical protein ACYDG2_22440 [Ruminiclostridium sp.]
MLYVALNSNHGSYKYQDADAWEMDMLHSAKYKVLEQSITGEYKSYVLDCYKAASTSKENAVSREDFIGKMQNQGFKITWTDSRKHITFTDKDGNKVRNTNLKKTFKESFGKEELEHGFERNLTEANSGRNRTAKNDRGLESNSGINRPIGEIQAVNTNLTIGKAKADISSDDRNRADRITQEQSIQCERNRIKKPRTIERSPRSQEYER